jgi:ubiquinone/menaquinone biosynthesis C-methylase UbiE
MRGSNEQASSISLVLARTTRSARSVLSLNRAREFATLCAMLDLQPGDALLDVGSGDGYWTMRFAGRVAQVTGLEPDEVLIEHARRLHHAPNMHYRQGVAESLPFPDATFDAVVSVSSVEHFADPALGLQEMFRVLRVGGRIAISVDTLTSENSSVGFRQWHRARHHVTRYFTEEQLVTAMTTIGFRVDGAAIHLFRSPVSRWARQRFIQRPRRLLPLFPVFRGLVALGEALPAATHGQIVVVSGARPDGVPNERRT